MAPAILPRSMVMKISRGHLQLSTRPKPQRMPGISHTCTLEFITEEDWGTTQTNLQYGQPLKNMKS